MLDWILAGGRDMGEKYRIGDYRGSVTLKQLAFATVLKKKEIIDDDRDGCDPRPDETPGAILCWAGNTGYFGTWIGLDWD